MTGRRQSAQARAKISAAVRGAKHPMYGRKHSEETRKKMSAAHKGVPLSPGHAAKVTAVLRANPPKRSAQWLANVTAANRSRPLLVCEVCGRSIKGRGNLARHLRTSHGSE